MGNLYYHFPSKSDLVDTLFDDYVEAVQKILPATSDVQSVDDAWFFLHTQFELIGAYRFLYRDMSDLLSKNRQIESKIQALITEKKRALQRLLNTLSRQQVMIHMDEEQLLVLATNMTVLMSYWLSYAYMNNPRQALEPKHTEQTLSQGVFHLLQMLAPYMHNESRAYLRTLAQAYL